MQLSPISDCGRSTSTPASRGMETLTSKFTGLPDGVGPFDLLNLIERLQRHLSLSNTLLRHLDKTTNQKRRAAVVMIGPNGTFQILDKREKGETDETPICKTAIGSTHLFTCIALNRCLRCFLGLSLCEMSFYDRSERAARAVVIDLFERGASSEIKPTIDPPVLAGIFPRGTKRYLRISNITPVNVLSPICPVCTETTNKLATDGIVALKFVNVRIVDVQTTTSTLISRGPSLRANPCVLADIFPSLVISKRLTVIDFKKLTVWSCVHLNILKNTSYIAALCLFL